MTGSPVTPTTATTSCLECIRGGWIWCSSKWHYEETTSSYSGENGTCCFNSATRDADISDNTKANVTNCPARNTNASGAGPTLNTAAFWCSSEEILGTAVTNIVSTRRQELALVNCRQKKEICGEMYVDLTNGVNGAATWTRSLANLAGKKL